MAATDGELLDRAQAGDREALGELFMAHGRVCYDLARSLTGSAPDAEDVCQDAFLRASRDIRAARGACSFRAWLLSMVVCAHRNRLDSEAARRRRERSCAMSPETSAPAMSPLDREELRRQLDSALLRLDEDRRLPVILHHRHGLSCAEAAMALSMPEGTVKANIHRGLEELRELMARAGYSCAALSAVEGALGEAPAVSVPASLAAFIKGLTLPASAKAAAGSAAAAAGALALGWKLLAGASLAAALGAGGWLGWRHLGPAAAAPAPEPRAAAAPEPPPGEALGRPVKLILRGVNYREALSQISAQTGLVWAAPNDWPMPAGRVTLKAEGTPARKVLDELARSAGLVWREGPGSAAVFNQECPDFDARRRALEAAAGGDEVERAEALYRLGYCGDMRALPHLARAMADRSLVVRNWAASLLHGLMFNDRSSRLGPFAKDQYRGRDIDAWLPWLGAEERTALVTALLAPEALLASAKDADRHSLRLGLLACLDDDERARAAILKGLDSRDAAERRAAVQACRLSPRETYGDKLLAMAAKADRDESFSLTGALYCFSGERFRRAWFSLETEKVLSIGAIPQQIRREDTWAIPQLLEAVKSGPPGRAREAAAALGNFAGTDKAAEISACLGAKYRQAPEGRSARDLLGTLARTGRPEGREALLNAMEHPVHGLDLIETMGAATQWPGPDEKLEDKILAVARSEDPKWGNVRLKAMLALGRLGGPRSVEFLKGVAMASHEVPKFVQEPAPPRNYIALSLHPGWQAVGALRRMGSQEAEAALAEVAAKSSDKHVRDKLRAEALAALAPAQAAAGLVEFADRIAGTAPAEPQLGPGDIAAVFAGVAGRGGPEVAETLRKLAGHDSREVRAAAAAGMRWYPERIFAEELVRLAGDADPGVAKWAVSTLSWEYFRGWSGSALAARLLAGDARERLVALKAMGWQGAAEHFDALARLAAGDGEEAGLARSVLAAPAWPGGSPRAVGWLLQELSSPDRPRRQAARQSLQRNLPDPRIAPALEEHAKAHPEEVKGQPVRPEPPRPPGPPEVF